MFFIPENVISDARDELGNLSLAAPTSSRPSFVHTLSDEERNGQ